MPRPAKTYMKVVSGEEEGVVTILLWQAHTKLIVAS